MTLDSRNCVRTHRLTRCRDHETAIPISRFFSAGPRRDAGIPMHGRCNPARGAFNRSVGAARAATDIVVYLPRSTGRMRAPSYLFSSPDCVRKLASGGGGRVHRRLLPRKALRKRSRASIAGQRGHRSSANAPNSTLARRPASVLSEAVWVSRHHILASRVTATQAKPPSSGTASRASPCPILPRCYGIGGDTRRAAPRKECCRWGRWSS
jgi:hypothetical protein